MKLNLVIVLFFVTGIKALAQNTPGKPVKRPLAYREVSGVVIDSVNNLIMAATVTLIDAKDTLKEKTDGRGQFNFKKVTSAVFTISVHELGFIPLVRKYFYNDEQKKIVLNPMVIKPESVMLKEVSVDGTPSIVYKTDTVEYRAKDYKVREYATVDEMLKKMEGMEVANDGSLTHQGQPVVRAKLNGKDYAGGDVARAIKNLPADIVEKIQIIDSYGDEADRTGIRDGAPIKLLNITTRADRSIGDIVRITPGVGNDDRYNAGLFAQHINANQEAGIIGNVNNTQNGVAPNTADNTGNSGTPPNRSPVGSGGTIKTEDGSVFYSDQWSKSIKVNTSYNYTDRTINSINSSIGQQFSTFGTTNFVRESTGNNNARSQSVSFEFEYAINDHDFLRIRPVYSDLSSNNITHTHQLLTGLTHQDQTGSGRYSAMTPNLSGVVFFQHTFKSPARNFTVQLDINRISQQQSNGSDKTIQYYKDAGETVLKDSAQNYVVNKNILTKNYTSTATYIEPITYLSQFEFKAKFDYRKYTNTAVTDSINYAGTAFNLPGLASNYQYSLSQSRVDIDYAFDKIKYNASVGFAVISSLLDGDNLSLYNMSTHYSHIKIIPILRFEYEWSNTQRFTINYSGSQIEPAFAQLQPFTDRSDPQNLIIGNPDLKPSFNNSVSARYNNYITKSKLNFSLSANASLYNDPVIVNTIQTLQPALNSYINEVHFLNSGERYMLSSFYNIAKQFDDRKYNLSLLGRITYQHYTTMSNNVAGFNSVWRYNEKLAIRMDPNDWLEVNPYISYDINRTFFSLNQTNTNIKTAILSIDGKMYFLKTWLVGYSASKNYINGINADITRNPLVINAYFEKQFLRRKNLVLNVQMYDILHQNNYINQIVTANSIINTRTNDLSRYVMVSLRLNLQKWIGVPTRNGTIMQRRGDGSFIYN